MMALKRSLALLVLPSLMVGCAATDSDEVGTDESALAISPVRSTTTSGGLTTIGPIGPTVAPPVTLPSYFDTGHRTATEIGVGWYENAVNPHTQLWRQDFDLDENARVEGSIAVPRHPLAGEDAGPTDSADGSRHAGLPKANAFAGQLVETRRFDDRIAGARERVEPPVVG